MPLPVRVEGVQSHRSTRGSHAPPRSRGKLGTGERVAGSTGEEGMLARDALMNILRGSWKLESPLP
jgi:hypothetical protein